jgi:hypothetical protein
MTIESTVPLACDLTAIAPDQRDKHVHDTEILLKAVQELRETGDGYALRLPDAPAMLLAAAEFITYERLCCPFFKFTLEAEAGQGPFWLTLSGGAGVKEFMRDNFVPQLA